MSTSGKADPLAQLGRQQRCADLKESEVRCVKL